MTSRQNNHLRSDCLNFTELLAQGIALISPTMTAALILPLAYAAAGEGTWLAYLFATVMLLFVAFNINQFASRSSTAGSMYTYTGRGLGPLGGAISGWCLIWAYLFISIAGLTGFSIFANELLGFIGLHLPDVLLFAIGIGIAWFLACKDVQLSTILMLILEGVSVSLILLLAAIVLFRHGLPIDSPQLTLQGTSFSGMGLAVVICIFSLVGFECPTAFGEEAKQPLRTIPRAVVWSLVLTGLFFVLMAYTEVYGFRGYTTSLDKATAPLNDLADLTRVGFLKAPISLGAMISFFSLALSCLNAGARILYPMSRHGIFHLSLGQAHKTNATPHNAITLIAVLALVIPTLMLLFGIAVLDAFGYAGTLGAFGFLFAYFLLSVAAPFYLHRKGWLRPGHILLSVISILCLMVPAVGSVYPVPPFPGNIFPYLFLGYFAIGAVWFLILRNRSPRIMEEIKRDFELSAKEAVPMP